LIEKSRTQTASGHGIQADAAGKKGAQPINENDFRFLRKKRNKIK